MHKAQESPSLPSSALHAAATPALGVGSLTAWIDHRGVRAMLPTPARNDLRKLWAAMRASQLYQSEAEAAAAENEALRQELAACDEALRQLGCERDEALAAAGGAQACSPLNQCCWL